MRCALCEREADLVRSHIIPRSFFEILPEAPPRVLSNTPGEFPKRSRTGIYDRIVCDPCERRFAPYDDYAAELLLNWRDGAQPVRAGDRIAGYEVPGVNYQLLKLFIIATIWRASVATHSFYARVRLGPFEATAREMLLREDPGDPDTFATWWSVFDKHTAPFIMDPFREHWGTIGAYRFYLGRVVAYVKVDRRPTPPIFAGHILRPDAPLSLINRKLEGSHDLKAVLAVAQANPGGYEQAPCPNPPPMNPAPSVSDPVRGQVVVGWKSPKVRKSTLAEGRARFLPRNPGYPPPVRFCRCGRPSSPTVRWARRSPP